jgi:hypothetical protein
MIEIISVLQNYLVRLLPGILLGLALLAVLRGRLLPLRLAVYIGLFILIRDVMTPLGLWRLGPEAGLWLRFHPDPLLLVLLGLGSLSLVLAMNLYDREARSLLVWFRGPPSRGLLVGIGCAALVACPVLILYHFVPLDQRGGAVARSLLPALLVMTLLGNLYEEVLFRGYLQGYLEKHLTAAWWTPALLAGLAFGFGHSFLALAVTEVGWTLLAFATWEGIWAGLVRARYGILPATLTHGLAIFLLTGGW